MLVNRGNAHALGEFRTVLCDRTAANLQNGAGVRRQNTGECLDQGTLASPVLTNQGVHLARAKRERDVVQCLHTRKGLAQASDAEQQI